MVVSRALAALHAWTMNLLTDHTNLEFMKTSIWWGKVKEDEQLSKNSHNNTENYWYQTFTKEFDGILKIPRAGSIFSSLAKDTSGLNQAQVTWTHNVSTSVGFKAPPTVSKLSAAGERYQLWFNTANQYVYDLCRHLKDLLEVIAE